MHCQSLWLETLGFFDGQKQKYQLNTRNLVAICSYYVHESSMLKITFQTTSYFGKNPITNSTIFGLVIIEI